MAFCLFSTREWGQDFKLHLQFYLSNSKFQGKFKNGRIEKKRKKKKDSSTATEPQHLVSQQYRLSFTQISAWQSLTTHLDPWHCMPDSHRTYWLGANCWWPRSKKLPLVSSGLFYCIVASSSTIFMPSVFHLKPQYISWFCLTSLGQQSAVKCTTFVDVSRCQTADVNENTGSHKVQPALHN